MVDGNVTEVLASMPIWYNKDNYIGLFFFILGVTGAAMMIYIGGVDKLLIGNREKVLLDKENEIAKEKLDIDDDLKQGKENDAHRRRQHLRALQDGLERERGFQRKIGLFLYLFIGGVISAAFASGSIQAFTFGAGWTAFVGLFGIKKDSEERSSLKDKNIMELSREYESQIRMLQNGLGDLETRLLNEYKAGFEKGKDDTLDLLEKR
jgi:hypothetical protein